jgi:hypothetical protein
MESQKQAELIRNNAVELQRLHKGIHETVKHRGESDEKRLEWQQACEEFHSRYDSLAFPGGATGAYERILAGDPATIDAALTFLEVRPFFFRSGYMWKNILQRCKRAPMSVEQAGRFAILLERYNGWKKARDLKTNRGALVRRDLLPLLLRFHSLFPVVPADAKFDGLVTVGDLYVLLCAALKIAPCEEPQTQSGVVRRPVDRSAGSIDSPEYWDAYRIWHYSPWTPQDVWATLVSAIRDVYQLDLSFEINPAMILREADAKGSDSR